MSDVVAEAQGPAQSAVGADGAAPPELLQRLDELEGEARAKLAAQGFKPEQVSVAPYLADKHKMMLRLCCCIKRRLGTQCFNILATRKRDFNFFFAVVSTSVLIV
jgi:hypothetical protein